MPGRFKYLRARDLKPGMRVKIGQLRYIYEVYILLSNTTHNSDFDEITGTVEFVGKEITPEASEEGLHAEWMCHINFFDEREAFDAEELDLLFDCSEL